MKNRFSRWPPWRPSWIFNQNDFSHFWSISHPDASYQVSSQLAFGFRRRSEKKIFKDFPWWPSWISDQQDFSYFWSTSPWYFLPSLESTGLLPQEMKWKIDFQDGGHVSHFGFPIGTILAIFDLQVPQFLLPSFESTGLSVQKKKQKNWFSRWLPWRPSWISDQHDFS